MNLKPRPSSLVLLVAAGCLVLGSTASAVAGPMISGAQIKNESVTSVDIKNKSLQATDLSSSAAASLAGRPGAAGARGPAGARGSAGVAGYEQVANSVSVPAGTADGVSVSCPGGKVVLGALGYWLDSLEAVQVAFQEDESVVAYTSGISSDDELVVVATCATVDSAARTTAGARAADVPQKH